MNPFLWSYCNHYYRRVNFKNTSESFAKMKELVTYCDKKNHRFGVNSVVQIFMTAIKQVNY